MVVAVALHILVGRVDVIGVVTMRAAGVAVVRRSTRTPSSASVGRTIAPSATAVAGVPLALGILWAVAVAGDAWDITTDDVGSSAPTAADPMCQGGKLLVSDGVVVTTAAKQKKAHRNGRTAKIICGITKQAAAPVLDGAMAGHGCVVSIVCVCARVRV